jgi:hypothetical protein
MNSALCLVGARSRAVPAVAMAVARSYAVLAAENNAAPVALNSSGAIAPAAA